MLSKPLAAQADDGIYIDTENKFSLLIPPSWFITQRKPVTPKLTRYQAEDILFAASSFVEGSSMSVTKTNAPILLRDFDIDWWFSPLSSLIDVGSPQLISTLLILQRQSEYEKRVTSSEIVDPKIVDDALYFSFKTPLAEGVFRSTLAKAYLRNNKLYVIWISALENVISGDYGKTLENIRNSFVLI